MSFRAPIGTQAERDSGVVWPGKWFDATGYLTLYSLGYHTGADLNLNFPAYDSDKHSGVYAMGDGQVTYAKLYSTQVWGKIIVINHGQVDGKPLFSRYGHVDQLLVQPGDLVTTGQQIATVGNAEGLFPFHLHFDISTSDKLGASPSNWPGSNLALVKAIYVDPQIWLQAHPDAAGGGIPLGPTGRDYYVIASLGLRVRLGASTATQQVGALAFGDRISLDDTQTVDATGYIWAPISDGMYKGDFIAMGPSDHSDTYLSRNPPAA